ncbi:PA2169 family four-helix-bundle protein [uncultured Brevundimonas sp.]|uniref:PA2169 family four-helix-bundle protein n=1 Tax=uncultured Brevundimonas sp. TaxID=213418 RepID=UPI00263A3559|nr:PA2169 family four-helix-bundle protein [uncultured Brevundimonas sp.]
MSANAHDIKVLNGLIEALIDCADGYTEAARDTPEPRYSQWLDRRASQYLALVETLKAEVRARGGAPEDNGSILAKASRAFSGFKQAVLGHQTPIFQMIQSAEDQVRGRFEKASADTELSVTTRDIVRRGLEQLPLSQEDLSELDAMGHS